ncbi:RING-H2 finger protein ATL29-like [Salvia splendens]|uniref:RING-H2 finger protein ATL29-like n=1 Tax=Salvia splendens TaxID=180675 RepID=UPI001C2647B6|nr:RING-H2 finger protein ATL29-like [Salvia splendens]
MAGLLFGIFLLWMALVSTYLINQDSGTALRHLPFLSSKATSSAGTAHLIVRHNLSYDAIQDEVRTIIRDHLQGDKLNQADEHISSHSIKHVWDKVTQSIETLPKYAELNVDLKIRITYSYVHMMGSRQYHGWSLCVKGARERACSCCICLEEITTDGVALQMQCKHLFHANCIVLWLRNTLCCPLCRYQMTTTPTIDWK